MPYYLNLNIISVCSVVLQVMLLTSSLGSPVYADSIVIGNKTFWDETISQELEQAQWKADHDLNLVYQRLIGKLARSPKRQKMLRSSQRQFIIMRDTDARLSALVKVGYTEYFPSEYAKSFIAMTTQRAELLKQLLELFIKQRKKSSRQ